MPSGIFMRVLNRAGVIAALENAKKAENGRFAHAMEAAANEIMQTSKAIYVPVDTGALMATGRVDKPVQTKGSFRIEMKYGGDTLPYAVNVHETIRNYRGGRQWKYLETPAKNFNYNAALPRLYRKLGQASISGPTGTSERRDFPLTGGFS